MAYFFSINHWIRNVCPPYFLTLSRRNSGDTIFNLGIPIFLLSPLCAGFLPTCNVRPTIVSSRAIKLSVPRGLPVRSRHRSSSISSLSDMMWYFRDNRTSNPGHDHILIILKTMSIIKSDYKLFSWHYYMLIYRALHSHYWTIYWGIKRIVYNHLIKWVSPEFVPELSPGIV